MNLCENGSLFQRTAQEASSYKDKETLEDERARLNLFLAGCDDFKQGSREYLAAKARIKELDEKIDAKSAFVVDKKKPLPEMTREEIERMIVKLRAQLKIGSPTGPKKAQMGEKLAEAEKRLEEMPPSTNK